MLEEGDLLELSLEDKLLLILALGDCEALFDKLMLLLILLLVLLLTLDDKLVLSDREIDALGLWLADILDETDDESDELGD